MGELSFEVTRTRLIRSSQIAQHYFHAAKPDHAEEVLRMKFVADNQPAEPVQPGKEQHPAAQRSAVLSLAPVLMVGQPAPCSSSFELLQRDHQDPPVGM